MSKGLGIGAVVGLIILMIREFILPDGSESLLSLAQPMNMTAPLSPQMETRFMVLTVAVMVIVVSSAIGEALDRVGSGF